LSFHGGDVFAVLASGASFCRGAIPHQSASQGATRGRPACRSRCVGARRHGV